MQYPIIDLITDAYLNNGWTGLELTYGKNLLNPDPNTFIPSPGLPSRYLYQPNIIPANTLANVSFYDKDTSVDITGIYFGCVESFQNDGLPYRFVWNIYNGTISNELDNRASQDGDILCTSIFLYPNNIDSVNKLFSRFYIQVELGGSPTPYEPYVPPTTDIKNRLKLPLIHYFPHPVIDALQRASAGTQTADDTEILQHYLTPLGIGGI